MKQQNWINNPRPIYDEKKFGNDWVSQAKYLSEFREEERAWFERLLASTHVQAVLHIPEDEPIFVLRAQDAFVQPTLKCWLDLAHPLVTVKKFAAAFNDLKDILQWQRNNPTKVKIPD